MALRLSLFYAATFLAIGLSMPFWPVWLQGRGLSAAEIGIVLSTSMWVRAFTNPLVAQLADRHGRPDRMLAALAWTALLANIAYLGVDGFWPILLIGIVAGAAFSAMFPMGDAVTMLQVRTGAVDYGRVRLWGSLTFILAATLGGGIIAGRTTELILWLVIGCMALQIGAVWLLPATRTGGTARLATPLLEIVRDRPFVACVAGASLLQASHAMLYGFATLHWRAAGTARAIWCMAARCVAPKVKACSPCTAISAGSAVVEPSTVQRTTPAPAASASSASGVSRANTRFETANSTISATTPSAHSAPITVAS